MFTGIIHHNGTIDGLQPLEWGARLRIRTTDSEPFQRGESLAVNGVCLTVLPDADGALLTDARRSERGAAQRLRNESGAERRGIRLDDRERNAID